MNQKVSRLSPFTSRHSPEYPSERTKNESRKKLRRNMGFLSVAFLALIVLFGLLGSSQIIIVLFLFTSILFEGISLSIFIFLSEGSWAAARKGANVLHEGEPGRAFPSTRVQGRDPVSSLYIFVKYASRGSQYSRTEVALLLKSMFQSSHHFEEKGELGSREVRANYRDSQFESDLRVVYYPYLPDAKRYTDSSQDKPRKASLAERDAYLASLQRVVKKLKDENISSPWIYHK